MYKYISSVDLKFKDIPVNKSWVEISKFAILFNPYESEEGYELLSLDESNLESLTINELRYLLYIEQRRWNHFCRIPEQATMQKLMRIIELIKSKLSN